jgi:DNA-binding transcriptional ArsR family regulator
MLAPACNADSVTMAVFTVEEAMRRDYMLMEAILGQLLQAPDPLIGTSHIARMLNVEQPVIRHHLHLLLDKALVQEIDTGVWRLTNLGHDYLEGAPQPVRFANRRQCVQCPRARRQSPTADKVMR